ncbi:DUF4350 domain-containing protein [Pseudomonas sp. SWRI153]|uniref:DUF4350 domain-containing protein n=1 Tax=Pseudomonas khorasanensis TaxID=2745508 RepID=A0A923F1A2_9PSED|nr:DUF4350 domain-containing protein [Pseudomonas khorasanensis]MBV4485409.1 DUF4350 domain-containing protein [Pseudomonas khorasanensis]
MTRRTLWLIGALLVALLSALSIYLYLKAQPYQEVVDHGPSPAAQANPYLAAEMFLRGQNINVAHAESLSVLPDIDPRQHTLLLFNDRSKMSPRQVDQVLNWARAGGRLVFVAESLWDEKTAQSNDLLLDRVQLQQFMSKDLKDPPAATGEDPYPNLTKLYLEDEDAPAYAGFDPAFHLHDPENLAQAWANSANATHMMQLAYGLGSITVVTDAELWKTPAIAEHDNAWLLWYLTADTDVTLLFNTEHDGLATLLWRNFPQAIVALFALIGLWLWHVGVRHGPVQAPAPSSRRQLMEHLRASADFILRHNGQQTLLQALQQDVLRRARRRHPGFEQLNVAEQWLVLSRLTRQPTRAISQALSPAPKKHLSSAEFCRQVAHLQTLRNAL